MVVGAASVTVTWKVVCAVVVPSLTVSVIVAGPSTAPGVELTVTVRFAPLPPNTILELPIFD